MEVRVLGCRGGYPTPGEACSGYLVTSGGTRIWVDAGAGTLDALLHHLDPWELDAIWISHLHPDHWTDLPIALHRMAVTAPDGDRRPPLVLGPPGWQRHTGVAGLQMPRERVVFRPGDLTDGAVHRVGELTLTTRAVAHGDLDAFGVRIDAPRGVLAYSGDTAPCPALIELAAAADLFLCEATFPVGTPAPIGMDAEQAGQAALTAGAAGLVLTHLLPGVDRLAAVAAAAEIYGAPVEVATQAARFSVPMDEQAGELA